jgi:hypothetical protein
MGRTLTGGVGVLRNDRGVVAQDMESADMLPPASGLRNLAAIPGELLTDAEAFQRTPVADLPY